MNVLRFEIHSRLLHRGRHLNRCLLLAGMVALVSWQVSAHDHNHPELEGWYRSLHAKGGAWCCNGDDAQNAEDWETKGNSYRVKIDGVWVDVPNDAVVETPNRDPSQQAKVWKKYGDGKPEVRCFLPGVLT